MTREEFLKHRKTMIGGSDSAALFNKGYGCYRRLIKEKRGDEMADAVRNLSLMELGNVLEPYVKDRLRRESGRVVDEPKESIRAAGADHFGVHVDGIIYATFGDKSEIFEQYPELREEPGVLECKALGASTYWKAVREGLSDSYILQVQHGCEVTGCRWGTFAILNRDSGAMKWFDFLADASIGAAIEAQVQDAWKRKEFGPLPDALDPSDPRCHDCGYWESCHAEGLVQIQSTQGEGIGDYHPEWAPLIAQYAEARLAQTVWAEQEKALKEEIKAKLGDTTDARAPGAKKITFYATDVKEYTVKARTQRTLRITLEKN